MQEEKTKKLRTDILICKYCDTAHQRYNKRRHRRSKKCMAIKERVDHVKKLLLEKPVIEKKISERTKYPYLDKKGNLHYLTLKQVHLYKVLGRKRYHFEPA